MVSPEGLGLFRSVPEQVKRLLDELRGADCFLVILKCAVMGCRRGEALGLY